ncbi:hypothetical protein FIBSPDRAFT_963632 [Athelia psychrophila]|uniref:DUF6533 domain-containing protein n=1 Tax=Athelia psychrophila TaxID=1759441 RepID=A0A165YSG1_9AGAM|nr:hypothetical protein FIBSPDRAFT_963632 [Fibularhizoctonia sp. CBS 109695]
MANPTGISYTHSESHSRKVTVSHLVKPSAAAPILLPASQVERLSMHVQEVALIRHARSNTLGGLVFVCWEALVTHDNEVQFIWSKPNTSFIKWLFLYIRSAGILGQIFNVFVTTQYPLSSAQCVYWFTVKCVIGQAMMSAFETVLILRVYALYGRSYRVAAAMLFFILAEITITSTAVWDMMPTLDFGPTCFTVLPHKATTYYMAGALSTQLAIVTLTLHKSSTTGTSLSRWSNNALSAIIKRDGTAACGTVFAVWTSYYEGLLIYSEKHDYSRPAPRSSSGMYTISSFRRVAWRGGHGQYMLHGSLSRYWKLSGFSRSAPHGRRHYSCNLTPPIVVNRVPPPSHSPKVCMRTLQRHLM